MYNLSLNASKVPVGLFSRRQAWKFGLTSPLESSNFKVNLVFFTKNTQKWSFWAFFRPPPFQSPASYEAPEYLFTKNVYVRDTNIFFWRDTRTIVV